MTRQEAIASGLTRYFSNDPCPHGHIGYRRTKSGECVICSRERVRRYPFKTEKKRRWRAAHPDRNRAHEQVAQAVKQGVLVRGSCEVPGCASEEVHAHHDDYTKPLDVRWVCPVHHPALDAERRPA